MGRLLGPHARHPALGVGPNHFPLAAPEFGYPEMHAHSLWLQVGAELGFPGLGFLIAFYGITMWRLRQMIHEAQNVDPWFAHSGRMVIAALVGFAVSGCFVSLVGLELPYYIVLIGAGALRLSTWRPLPPKRSATARTRGKKPSLWCFDGGDSREHVTRSRRNTFRRNRFTLVAV